MSKKTQHQEASIHNLISGLFYLKIEMRTICSLNDSSTSRRKIDFYFVAPGSFSLSDLPQTPMYLGYTQIMQEMGPSHKGMRQYVQIKTNDNLLLFLSPRS